MHAPSLKLYTSFSPTTRVCVKKRNYLLSRKMKLLITQTEYAFQKAKKLLGEEAHLLKRYREKKITLMLSISSSRLESKMILWSFIFVSFGKVLPIQLLGRHSFSLRVWLLIYWSLRFWLQLYKQKFKERGLLRHVYHWNVNGPYGLLRSKQGFHNIFFIY